MKNNNNYTQKRETEEVVKRQRKENATAAHYKEIKSAIIACANNIAFQYGLSQDTCGKIIALIYEDKDAVVELPLRINYVANILEKYGYSYEKAISIIDSNFSLIKQKPLNLIHNLAIANQYGFDKELLVNNSDYSNINEKEMYALIEELKANNIDVTKENILKLNTNIRNSGKMSEFIKLHQLAQRTMLVYRTLYDRNMSNKTLSKTK